MTQIKPTYTYQNISMVPRNISRFRSRSSIDISQVIGRHEKGKSLSMPVLPAPMDTISGIEMCQVLWKNGMMGMIHRFQDNSDKLYYYNMLKKQGIDCFIAVGLEDEDFITEIYESGARYFILDIANGFNIHVKPLIQKFKLLPDTFIICGNVASKEGFEYLADLGVDAIRVGIGNGSMCTTSIMTGVGQGIVSALSECRDVKEKKHLNSLIIADGGIKDVGHISLALGLGADLVMIGRMLAGTKEAEGNILKYNGKLYKAYRGSASFAVQNKSKTNPYYIEGDETIVSYKGSVQNILDQIDAGLRSAFSYMGAANIEELQRNANFVQYVMDEKLFSTS